MIPVDEDITRRLARESFAAKIAPLAHLLSNPKVTDIMLTAPAKVGEPGFVWLDVVGSGLGPAFAKDSCDPLAMAAIEAELLIRDIGAEAARDRRIELNETHPQLSCRAALGQFRFEALIPPAGIAPSFTMRKYLKLKARLQHYVESGELAPPELFNAPLEVRQAAAAVVAEALAWAATSGLTILVCGETGSGKTTLLNALIHEAGKDSSGDARRLLVIEDTPELDCPEGPSSRIEVLPRDIATGISPFDYRSAIVSALRQRPNAIVLGELREPDDAVQALRAWNTGHQGLGTLHAPSCTELLWQVYSLCRQSESGRHVTERAVASTIQVAVHVKREHGRRVIDVQRVLGWKNEQFELAPLVAPKGR